MILLHIGYDGVVCYEIMKHANRVTSVIYIKVFPFKINVTYLYKKRNIIVHVGAMCVHKS